MSAPRKIEVARLARLHLQFIEEVDRLETIDIAGTAAELHGEVILASLESEIERAEDVLRSLRAEVARAVRALPVRA
jgi:hypothetical protein